MYMILPRGSATGFSSHPFSYGEWGFTAMAVNRAVSSHLDRVGLPGLAFRTWRSCGRAGGTAAPWWRGTPEVSPPSGWNEGYEPAILWGGGRADCPGLPRPTWKGAPAALGLGSAWLGARWAADVAERTEYTGPHGQNGSPPRSEYSISNRLDKLLGTHPLNWFPPRIRYVRSRLPNSGGISPLNWL